MARLFPRSLQLTGLCSPKDATYTVCILLDDLPDCVTIPQDVERDNDNDGPRLFLHYNDKDFTSLTVSTLMERLHPELQPIIPAAYQAPTTRYSLPMELAKADDPTNFKVFFYAAPVHPHAFVQKVLHEPNGTRLLVMDFRNTGTVSAEDLLQRTFMGYMQTTRTTSQSTTCAAGRAPSTVSLWTTFVSDVQGFPKQPAICAPHRTLFKDVQPQTHRLIGQESDIENLLDNENFKVFNNLATGAPLWAGPRQFSACFAQPDRTMTNFLHTLLPIEVKPTSVIPKGTDLLKAIKTTLEKLHSAIKAADHHWGQLSLPDRHKWEEIVRSSPASKAFTQAYGYSCANKTRYAILTNGIDWWFIERLKNSIGDVRVTPSINIQSTDPTVAQCLNYIAKQALESPGCPLPSPKTLFPPSFKSQFPHQTRTLLLPPDSHAPAVLLHVDGTEQFFDDGDVDGLEDTVEGLHGSTLRAVVFKITIALKVVDLYKMEDGLAPLEHELACYHYMEKNNGTVAPHLKAFGMLGNGAFPILGTEWIDGHPLCENDFALFPEVQKAYSNLHSMYIKHGDVDSCNILVTNDKVKLVDFAQAIIFDKDQAGNELDKEMEDVEVLLCELGETSQASAAGIPL
ncbi:hypothetical protein PSTG_11819 [Puccinia striiformis f. sp. tritici PST-78]|uniref:non-specific serine/threonine protein kinase n=1 Tax=Puccinia striiformis f. sp. tritici PST-78 TaxID=1165861 RepID=A0A0L0V6B1_9BASI|nr:hypothetical protein PSTG_11819 [Puccinia striiformis f. sp. tritici PST-78]